MQEIEHLVHFRIVLFLFSLQFISFGQVYPDKKIDSLINAGIEFVLIQDYESAEKVFSQLKDDYPSFPMGNISLASLEITRAYDFRDEVDAKKIENLLNEALKSADNYSKKYNNSAWSNYFYGLIFGFNAYFNALQENWITAMSQGLKSVSYFNDCLKKDSLFYDAMIAIGTYKYWRSRKTEFINWLPFIANDKKEGISLILRAKDKKSYNLYFAYYSLIWIYIEEEDYRLALNLAEQGIKKYPMNRLLKWSLISCYEKLKDYSNANKYYFELLNDYNTLKVNQINRIEILHKIAQNLVRMRNKKEALKILETIPPKESLSDYEKKYLDKRYERINNLTNRLKKALLAEQD